MKKPPNLAVVMLLSLVLLAGACQSTDGLVGPSDRIEPTSTPLPTATATETPLPTAIPTPTPEPTLGIGATTVNPIDGGVLVYVPAGEFLMGSDDAWDDEKPKRLVYLDAFWIYQHPVTGVQFAAFVVDSGHQTTAEDNGWGWVWDGRSWVQAEGAYWAAPEGPGSSLAGQEDHPVIHVSWLDAAAYCQWAGGRLPSEAEWEKAARGTDGRRYPWGDDPVTGDRGNFCDVNCPMDWAETSQDDGYARTSPVGSYPAGVSPYGALDMAGNVWEWVADLYEANYYQRAPAENPSGPTGGASHVLRGGSWSSFEGNLRAAKRGWYCPGCWYYINGFRCVRAP